MSRPTLFVWEVTLAVAGTMQSPTTVIAASFESALKLATEPQEEWLKERLSKYPSEVVQVKRGNMVHAIEPTKQEDHPYR